jgi:hypothetical protein
MGISIYYTLKAKIDAEGARRLVRKLHQRVSKLPFDDVTPIFEIDPPDGKFVFEEFALKGYRPGLRYLERKREDGRTEMVGVPPLHSIFFSANLEGSETAQFGLATHPPVVVHREDVVRQGADGIEEHLMGAGPTVEFPTRLRGWYSWTSYCKTQYAGDPKLGGDTNFLRAHVSIFKAVEAAKGLGFKTHIRDDAKYWRHKSEKKLLAELHRWDELIAGFAGGMKDHLKSAGMADSVASPIFERGDFEHLEAKGVERLKAMGKGKKLGKRRRKG